MTKQKKKTNRIDIVRLQLLIMGIQVFAQDKEPNIRRAALDTLIKMYEDESKLKND